MAATLRIAYIHNAQSILMYKVTYVQSILMYKVYMFLILMY